MANLVSIRTHRSARRVVSARLCLTSPASPIRMMNARNRKVGSWTNSASRFRLNRRPGRGPLSPRSCGRSTSISAPSSFPPRTQPIRRRHVDARTSCCSTTSALRLRVLRRKHLHVRGSFGFDPVSILNVIRDSFGSVRSTSRFETQEIRNGPGRTDAAGKGGTVHVRKGGIGGRENRKETHRPRSGSSDRRGGAPLSTCLL